MDCKFSGSLKQVIFFKGLARNIRHINLRWISEGFEPCAKAVTATAAVVSAALAVRLYPFCWNWLSQCTHFQNIRNISK